MKKLILSAALVTGSFLGVANADVMALGSANMKDNGDGTVNLGCPGTGFCYDSDRDKLSDIKAGDHIWVHINGERVEYIVMSATVNIPEIPLAPVDPGN